MSALQAERYWDLVDRINRTRDELLEMINKTYSDDIVELINNRTDEIILEIYTSENETATQMSGRFDEVYDDFSALGQSMKDIFGRVE